MRLKKLTIVILLLIVVVSFVVLKNLYITFAIIVALLVMFNFHLNSQTKLKMERELEILALIDVETGLYNRQYCNQLFEKKDIKKEHCILVVKLDDFSEISIPKDFSNALKSSCRINLIPPFLGRYSDGEFIVYYDKYNVDDNCYQPFLDELECFVKENNERETRYQISYNVGVATVEEEGSLTVKQLFDKACSKLQVN